MQKKCNQTKRCAMDFEQEDRPKEVPSSLNDSEIL